MLDPRQLRILQTIPLQQSLSLLPTQEHMFRHELMLRDVHQQLALHERLDATHVGHARDDLERARGGRDVGYEDARVVVGGARLLYKVSHVLDADCAVLDEGDVDCSNVCFGVWVGGCWQGRVFAVHFVRRGCGEVHC